MFESQEDELVAFQLVTRIKWRVESRSVSYKQARKALNEFLFYTAHLAPDIRETRSLMRHSIEVEVGDDSYMLCFHYALSDARRRELQNMVCWSKPMT